jgi:DNA-binding phage protein
MFYNQGPIDSLNPLLDAGAKAGADLAEWIEFQGLVELSSEVIEVEWSMKELDEYLLAHQRVCEEEFVRYKVRPTVNKDTALEYVQRELMKAENFKVFLWSLMRERGIASNAVVYNKALIDRRHFHKLINDKVVPKKETVLAIAIALELDLNQTQQLLETVGYTFTPSSRRDLIIKFFIHKGICDRYVIDAALVDLGEESLTG